MILNYLKTILYMFIIIIGLTIILTIFNYFSIINGYLFSTIKLLIPVLAIIYGGFLLGSISTKKGYLEGIKLGIITIIIFLLLNLILKNGFELKNLIYFLILIGTSMLGSMIGINKKRKA